MIKLINLLLEQIREEIKEKPLLGKGGHKQVYTMTNYKSKDLPDSSFVAKKWKNNDTVNGIVKREYEIYLKNKNMFAPIDKIDFNRQIMIQKRLDTKKAQLELSSLKKYVAPYYSLSVDYVYNDLPEFFEFLVEEPSVSKKVRDSIKSDQLKETYDRWIQFTKDMFAMDRKFKNLLGNQRDLIVDFHDGNVGYDSDGKIKFIDI